MRVLLADPHSKVRWALRTVLAEEPALAVIGEVSTSQSLVSRADELEPDLIFLDWALLDPPQARTLATLHGVGAHCGIVVVSERAELKETALAAGADAFLCKCDPPDQFLISLRELVIGCSGNGHKRPGALGRRDGDL